MFIDIHVHTRMMPGPSRNGKQPYATPTQLIERYDAVEIERAVVLPGVNPECAYQPQSNEEVLAIARENDRFIPFCNVDPRAVANSPTANLGPILRYYKDQGAKGLGEITANLPFLDPLVQNLFRHCQEVGFPVTFHIAPAVGGFYGLYDDPGLPQLEITLQRFPNLIFLGHSQPFWAEMAPLPTVGARAGYPDTPVTTEGAIPRLMRRYPNLCGDLSANSGCNALARDKGYAARFLTEFQDRLFFGTDICAPDTPTPLVDLLLELCQSGAISETAFQKVARENAIRLLSL
ncbi:MAG: amidohydrolase family protein [Anaerolineae bacterium]